MRSKGFSLVELVIVMAVIALILSIAIPNFRAMQQEGQMTQVEGQLNTLKTACISYWKNHEMSYPTNIHTDLLGASPKVISSPLKDPWATDATNDTFGYLIGSDSIFGQYFIVYTKGPLGDTLPTWDSANQRVIYSGTGRVVSSGPVIKN